MPCLRLLPLIGIARLDKTSMKPRFSARKKLFVLMVDEGSAQSAIIELKQFFGREPLAIRQPVGSPIIDNYRIGHPENMKCSRGVSVEMIAQSA